MANWLDWFGLLLLDATVAATALLGLAALLMVGTQQPARRCVLARWALIGVLAVWPLVALRPIPPFDLVGPLGRLAPPIEPATLPAPLASSRGGIAVSPWLGRGLVMLYGLGFVVGLTGLGLGGGVAAWLARHSSAPSTATMKLYRELPFDGRHRPRLRVGDRAGRPVLLGGWWPIILIPPELDRPEAADALRLSLLHELVHAQRFDHRFGLASELAGVAWFFLPPLWWVRAQLRLDQEFLADRIASARYGPNGRYASSLVDLASPTRSGTPAGGGSALVARVLMLVRCPFPVELRSPRWWHWGAFVVLSSATLLATGVTVAGGGGAATTPSSTSTHGTFTLARLTVDRTPVGNDGRPRPYPVLVRLPRHFRLTFEVLADPPTLAWLRVSGQRLAAPSQMPLAPGGPEGWHAVVLNRGPQGLSVTVDSQPVPPGPSLLSETLTFQSGPHQPIQVRNLQLTW